MKKLFLAALISSLLACGSSDPIEPLPPIPEFKFDSVGRVTYSNQIQQIPCPNKEHWLIIGQSNAANSVRADWRLISNAVQKYKSNCYTVNGPMLGATGDVGINPYETDVAIVSFFSVGGASITRFTTGDLRQALEADLTKVDRIIWHQGETDHINDMSKEEYLYHFSMLEALFKRYSDRITIVRSTYCSYKPEYDNPIGQALDKLRLKYSGPDSDIINPDYRTDYCHYKPQGVKELWNQLNSYL
jgi:hypothetical protein